jgi:hypothetical protein
MSIHSSNFGSFAGNLHSFTDLDGFVPEEGDLAASFNFGHDEFTNDFDSNGYGYEGCAEEQWRAFVEMAVEATQEASGVLATWREDSNPETGE